MTHSDAFLEAQRLVKTLSKTPGPSDLLALYALYKQATQGDVQGSRPGMLDVKGRAKFDAWASKKGLSASDAESEYVALVERLRAAG